MTLAEQNDLIVTLPTRRRTSSRSPTCGHSGSAVCHPPLELKMAWSPLLHNNAPHRWVRQFVTGIARSLPGDVAN